jgi:hypothetical protein
MKKRYCWLDMKTGKFSNSWSEEDHQKYLKDVDFLNQGKERPDFKLIEYTCLTDPNFEFIHHMKLRL